MINMKKIYLLAAALVMATGAAYGQGGDELNRQVNVAKDFMPRVNRASKLAIQPQLADTTSLRPDLDYTVRPRSWAGRFDVAPIRAAQMNTGTYNAQYPFYLKAGGGFPGHTVLDLYITSSRPGASGFGAYVNHRAQLAKLENHEGVKRDAQSTQNSVGVFGKAAFGRQKRLGISGELGFDYDVWTDYNAIRYNSDLELAGYKLMQHYATPRASLVFGNDFKDLSYFNFRLGGEIYNLTDRRDYSETGGNAFLEVGKKFDLHRLVLGAAMDIYGGKQKYEYYSGRDVKTGNGVYMAYADYRLESGKVVFGLGAHFAYDKPGADYDRGSEFTFLPQAELRFALADGFNPYAVLTSTQRNNSRRNMSARNPFFEDSSVYGTDYNYKPVTEYTLRAGFSGSFASVFSYNVYAGGGIIKNDTFYALEIGRFADWDDPTKVITLIRGSIPMFDEKLKYFAVGAELEARIGGGFTVILAGEYRKHDSDWFDRFAYLPKYKASLALKYTHRDRFSIRSGVDLRGEYDRMSITYYDTIWGVGGVEFGSAYTTPVAVDISLTADYNISEKLGVFVEGRNLANKKLYPYPGLPGVGVNVSAGVKVRF